MFMMSVLQCSAQFIGRVWLFHVCEVISRITV